MPRWKMPLNTKNQQQFGETYFVSTPECCELDNLDGKHFVVEWQIFPGHTTTQLLQEAQNMMENTLKIHSPEFRGPHHIVDVQRHRLDHKKKHDSLFGKIRHEFLHMPTRFTLVIGVSSVQETRINGTRTLSHKPNGEWNRTAEMVMLKVAETRDSGVPRNESFDQGIAEMQKSKESLDALQRGTSNNSTVVSPP